MTGSSETIELTLPRSPRYYGVARMVIGGLAAGIELSYDALDDLQLAIGSLLDNRDLPGGDTVALHVTVTGDGVSARIGPFAQGSMAAAFAGSSASGGIDLARLLETVVDEVVTDGDGDGDWIVVTKRAVAAA